MGWGYNNYGQTNIPTDLSGVLAIAASRFHSLALRSDGTVIGWGYNAFGQTNIPAGLSEVKAVAAGDFHSLAANTTAEVSPPTVDSVSPYEAAAYRLRARVIAAYSCSDNVAVASCTGTVPNGSLIDTNELGEKQFTITAVDVSGNITVKTIKYKVISSTSAPPPKRGK